MANKVYIAASLDGFIAAPDGGIDWLTEIPNPENSDFGYLDFIRDIDALIMGRGTFEKVLTFDPWPYEIPVFVMSRTLTALPEEAADKAELVKGGIHDILNLLTDRGMKNFYIDGGKLIQSFLKLDLIDEMTITTLPIVLGDGIPLFGKQDTTLRYRLEKSEVLCSAMVKNRYTRIRTV